MTTPGPHVFGDGRIGCWFVNSVNFTDKLKHRLPRVKALGVTDAFLPREATLADKNLVLSEGMFMALFETPPHGLNDLDYAKQALADVNRLKVGALELNIEGVADALLGSYITDCVAAIRKTKPNLKLRINVVPYKGAFLPMLLAEDPQLFVIVQNYLGNMDARCPEDEIVRDLVDRGIPPAKVSVMYGAHVSWAPGKPRVPSLPQIRTRGSIYTDDLLADAGYIS